MKILITHPVCDYPLFTAKEQEIKALLQNGDFAEAEERYRQYDRLTNFFLPFLSNENAYVLRKRKQELTLAVENNRGVLDCFERVDNFCALWADTGRLTQAELKSVLQSGRALLAEGDALHASNGARLAEKRQLLRRKLQSMQQTLARE